MMTNEQIKQILTEIGFTVVSLNGETVYERNSVFYKFTYINSYNSYVIEIADNLSEAKKNRFEDGDMISADATSDEFKNFIAEFIQLS